ncbi:MAG TPA: redoxin domain-containing protein [Pyrinomonadaceae bacterium]|nr:redoxin domain-containing protein [Pyrinomonadaceae bacterium]
MLLKSRRSLTAATISILLLVSSVAFAMRATSKKKTTALTPVEFSLRAVDGQRVSSDEVRGQVVVLAFGASWLPITRKQVQGIRKLADTYSAHGVIVYWVSTDSEKPSSRNYASDDQLRAFARKYDLNLTILRDPEGKVSKQFGVDQIPAVVILDKQGEVYGEPINGLDPEGNLDDKLAKPLDALLKRTK